MTRSIVRPARLAAIGVFALAGLIFWVSFDTAQGTNLRSDSSMLRLSDLIQERSRQNAELENQAAGLRRQVDSLARRDDGSTRGEDRRIDALEKRAGLKKLTGQGLTVTLDDAPSNATAKVPGLPDPEPNDLVIHQQDLQAVVNALWKGGAKGIKVMDQRLISTSAVRCVGNTLILQGRVYSPPYKVTAVGDPDRLRAALDAAPAIQNYQEYVDAYGLGWKVEQHKAMTLPGYSGTVDLRQAEPVE
ncbi:DUF881 domain-containing protein [Streptomyces albus]|uniref:DUF881 domain-containing protein n=1 Tax=Streptomyces albus TaxID=1888 RepID=A0A8H1LAY3_9ACTN|nr:MULTISPECIES: DUF881 domain-containing protein [Streptomyces]KPC96970.1 membrane protein [Streptomyces sp. NRRL F-6602]EPD91265.1 hypothetical protein HMPREF1486_05199 [Streptomyces sp. HPH0547]MDI6410831.1 DUF881 domain-containing protein [Streptomyces albus]TGG81509.1 DUF881 domain-containing protein [Streptomyces albus]UVN55843.1 DUF881 domain-containing protein [Streptomyces albus]